MFSMGDRVRFANTSDVELEGKFGKIIGEYHKEYPIVLLDDPLPSRPEHLAIVMSVYCLVKVTNVEKLYMKLMDKEIA